MLNRIANSDMVERLDHMISRDIHGNPCLNTLDRAILVQLDPDMYGPSRRYHASLNS
jgi:hypothetical protein